MMKVLELVAEGHIRQRMEINDVVQLNVKP